MSEPGRSNVRILLPEQSRDLLDLHVRVSERSVDDMPREIIGMIAAIAGTKAALAVKEEGMWVLFADMGEGPSVPEVAAAGEVFDRVGDAETVALECWSHEGEEWTLVGLTRRSATPAVLMLHRDWTLSAATLVRLGENLLLAERTYALASGARIRVATHRLSRALARSTGYSGVADVAVRSAARAVRAGIVTLGVADADNQALHILATHGYPLKLVEHLRIERGDGIMGSVYQSGHSVRVKDVSALAGGHKRRSRYRTNSFAAVPITTGQEVLGVLCVTDRLDGRPFTRSDLGILRTLAAPLALALLRERALAQAGSYAQAAAIDPVSGLFNRRYFHARLDEELQRAHRHGMAVGLLMIDVDDFKAINDTYGHLVGDTAIRTIADILRRSVRVFDICTRFGGEEFAVVMPGSGAEDAGRIAERIRERIQNYVSPDPGLGGLRLTVSVGLSVSIPGTSARDLIGSADMALYQAKRTGKNQVRALLPGGTSDPGGGQKIP